MEKQEREQHEKIFSKTTRPRAIILGMLHHLGNLYQVCSNNAPGAKNGPFLGSHVLHRLIRGKHEKIFLSETIRPRAIIFGMLHHLMDPLPSLLNYAPGVKNGPALEVTCFA